jgi:hypothetical protein
MPLVVADRLLRTIDMIHRLSNFARVVACSQSGTAARVQFAISVFRFIGFISTLSRQSSLYKSNGSCGP